MKRSWCLSLWIGILVFVPCAYAADPTPTTSPGLPQNTVTIDDGTITRLDFTQTVPALNPTGTTTTPTGTAPAPTTQDTTFTFKSGVTSDVNLNIPDLKDNVLLRLEGAYDSLTPQEIKDRSQDPKNDMRVSGCVTFCTDNNGTVQEKSSGCYISGADPNDTFNQLNNYAKSFASISQVQYQQQPDENGNFWPKEKVPLIVQNAPPCEPGETGEPVASTPVPFSNGGLISNVLASLTKFFQKLLTPQHATKGVVLRQITPVGQAAALLVKQYAGKTDYLPEEQQKQINNSQGSYQSWLPAEQEASIIKTNAQSYNFGIDDPVPIPINFTQIKTLQNYDQALLCSVTSPGLDHPSDCPPLTSTTGAPTNGDVCAIADKYHIPCCQLEGIMQIETGSGKDYAIPSNQNTSCGSYPDSTCCYQGFTCGPANIKCNQASAFAGSDNPKPPLCTREGTAVLLARAMRLKLCQADHIPVCESTYNWSTAGQAAMDPKYDLPPEDPSKSDKENLYNYRAAGYFYGMNQGCVTDACSQYLWGAGKSYCDSVRNYCLNGVVLNQYPHAEFCAACSARYVQLGLPPLNCP